MHILQADARQRRIVFIPENVEDLWLVEKILEPGDVIKRKIRRRIKREGERGKGEVVEVLVELAVEEVQFHEYSKSLRVKGKIVWTRDERVVGLGKYHTIEVRPGERVELIKNVWREWVVTALKQAEKERRLPRVLIVTLDNRSAELFLFDGMLTPAGRIENPHPKEGSLSEFFGQVKKKIQDVNHDVLIIAGPSVIPDIFRRFLGKGEVVKVPLVGRKGAEEVVRRTVERFVEGHRYQRIWYAMDECLRRLAKEGRVSIGKNVFGEDPSRIETLLVHEELFWKNREKILPLIDAVWQARGKVYIVPKGHPRARELLGLGGVVALLRW